MVQRKPVSKAMFLCVALSIFLVCALAGYPLAVVLARELGSRSGASIFWIAIAGLGFSWLVAEGLFKLPGMSRSGETLEVRVRTSVFPREAETWIRAGPCALAPEHLLRSQLDSTRRSSPAYGLIAEHH
jgi:hypothetical protein